MPLCSTTTLHSNLTQLLYLQESNSDRQSKDPFPSGGLSFRFSAPTNLFAQSIQLLEEKKAVPQMRACQIYQYAVLAHQKEKL
jgi:hypothetical protein